uniref:Uncharacterized protein n=1 Tax=Chromera velia CCMP2878 TaxID=1169474 RepID=A0A0G4HU55_9ALVE|eukprot:Cvel_8595.t1-p1 / transcript=Cvel_8595.t1 / gene=Cvel_8595 / organism=Chromera_velia_CCMP2878 / gene_product=hypothetical protein / transcript_product=hypothetical protein / location=Cvel_scaffold477:25237-33330(-) / protein_length=972 / sequence_SO=supercontig / SO=protein_coding / is_pseudo=false
MVVQVLIPDQQRGLLSNIKKQHPHMRAADLIHILWEVIEEWMVCFTSDVSNHWGLGNTGYWNLILVFLSHTDRVLTIYTGKQAKCFMTDSVALLIVQEAIDCLKQAGHFSPQAVDKNDPYATRAKDQLLNGKDIQFEHVTVEPQDPHKAVSDPTTLAGLGGDHPDVLLKSVTFKTDWEETKGLVAHHFNEAMQGMLYDGTDPTRIDRLRTAISRSIKACGLTTITMNKNSTGCRKYRKMITTFLKKQLGGNVLDSLDSAFAPLGTDTLYEEDLFCLWGWLESQTVKDPWPVFLSAKESVFHFVRREKPTDTLFPLWIHEIQKKYRAIGKMDLGDRRVDGVCVKNLAGNLQNKRVFYKMKENDIEISSLYVLAARACGSVLRGEELKRLMDGRIMTEAELCALFTATFGMAFPDEKGGGGQQGKKDYVMITYDELQKLQQGHPNGGSLFGYRGRGGSHQRGRGGRGRNFQRPETPHRQQSHNYNNNDRGGYRGRGGLNHGGGNPNEEQEASTDERSTESEEEEDWIQLAASSTDEEKKARRREFRRLYRIRQRKKKTFAAAVTATAAVQSKSDTDSLDSPFISDPKVLMTEQLEDCGVNEEFVQKALEGSWSSGRIVEDTSKLSLMKDSGSTGVVTFSFGWLRMVQALFPLADLGHWIWQPTEADPGPSWSTANGMVGVRGVWAGGFHLTDAAVLSARCVVLDTEDIVPPLIGMKFLEAWSARIDYGTKRMLLLHPGAKKQHLSIQWTTQPSGLLTLPFKPGPVSKVVGGNLAVRDLRVHSLVVIDTGEEVLFPQSLVYGDWKERRRVTGSTSPLWAGCVREIGGKVSVIPALTVFDSLKEGKIAVQHVSGVQNYADTLTKLMSVDLLASLLEKEKAGRIIYTPTRVETGDEKKKEMNDDDSDDEFSSPPQAQVPGRRDTAMAGEGHQTDRAIRTRKEGGGLRMKERQDYKAIHRGTTTFNTGVASAPIQFTM